MSIFTFPGITERRRLGIFGNIASDSGEADAQALGLSLQRRADVVIKADRNWRGDGNIPGSKPRAVVTHVVHRGTVQTLRRVRS